MKVKTHPAILCLVTWRVPVWAAALDEGKLFLHLLFSLLTYQQQLICLNLREVSFHA